MPGPKPIPVCRECGAPRDPTCRMALCTAHAKAFRKAQNDKHRQKRTKRERLQGVFDRLNWPP